MGGNGGYGGNEDYDMMVWGYRDGGYGSRVMEIKWGNGGYGGNEDYDMIVWWL